MWPSYGLSFILILCAGCTPAALDDGSAPADDTLSPSQVQGDGSISPLEGQTVTLRGVVSGDFQDDDADTLRALGGFYVQNETADGDARTSDGLFVYDRNAESPDVEIGDRVQVTGIVAERFGETQLTAQQVLVVGSAEVRSLELGLPVSRIMQNSDGLAIPDLEAYEGMFVSIAQPMFVQGLHGLERFGEIMLSAEPRQMQFTSTNRPGPAAYSAHLERLAAQVIVLDDGSARQNVAPILYVNGSYAPDFALRVGDAAEALQGVLRYSRGSGPHGMETWRLMPTMAPQFVNRNPRPARPDAGGDVVIASFNALNYFAATDTGAATCGPRRDEECRGADSAPEFERQRAKTAATINALNADVVGLMELDNTDSASIDDLLAAINERADEWRAIRTGVVGTDTIRVALIYQKARVEPVGRHAILDAAVDARFDDARNRPVIAQTFRARAGGRSFTVAVAHLKSKGSPCDEAGDPDRSDGQGNCNGIRTRAASALAEWLADDPTGTGSTMLLAIGDFNAYMNEDPVRAMEEAGYGNLLRRRIGDSAWSFVYRGESGALDHAFASSELADRVSGVAEWHINADEAPLYDYNLEFDRDPGFFDASSPWRSSDHDPLLIGLRLFDQ